MFKASFVFSVSLPKNNHLADPNSDFHSPWKGLLAHNNKNITCTLVHLFCNETILARRKRL